jgi:subtilisin family serine protease
MKRHLVSWIAATGLAAATTAWSEASAPKVAPDRVIVTFAASFAPRIESFPGAERLVPLYPEHTQTRRGVAQRFAQREARRVRSAVAPDLSRTYVLHLAPGQDAAEAVVRLRRDPRVAMAELDQQVSASLVPNDPQFRALWGIAKIGAPAAWNTSTGEGITVAVVDTGLDLTHPDIAANVWTNAREIPGNGIDDDGNGFVDDVQGWDFVDNDADPRDDNGHGSHVSGTIAAAGNNGVGVIGVAWRARIMPLKALGRYGFGYASDLARAIVYATDNGADVINNSWDGGGDSSVVHDAVVYAYSHGAVVVAAAGNFDDDSTRYFPARYPEVITVGATAPGDIKAPFSNWGKIDVSAPGMGILSLRATGTPFGQPKGVGYAFASGTSMAAPHVAGVAALVLSRRPDLSVEELRQALRSSAVEIGAPGVDLLYGSGRLDAKAALHVDSVLVAKFLGTVNGAQTCGATPLAGIAEGTGFARYTLDYGFGPNPTRWTRVVESATPVTRGSLGVFDPSALPRGRYALRLTAYDTAGRAFVDRIDVIAVDPREAFVIVDPWAPAVPTGAVTYPGGADVYVYGSVQAASARSYAIDWARGIDRVSGWSTEGVVLFGGGLPPAFSLGYWSTTAAGITEGDYYTLRLRVDNGGTPFETRTLVYIEPDLLGTPAWLWTAPGPYSGVLPLADPAGTRALGLVRPRGDGLAGAFEKRSGSGDYIDSTSLLSPSPLNAAAAELDGTAGDEVVVAELRGLRLISGDGTSSVLDPGPGGDLFWNASVVIADLDGDGAVEIVALGRGPGGADSLYAWEHDGTLRHGFPVLVGPAATSRLLVADVDAHAGKEVIVAVRTSADGFALRAVGADGKRLPWSSRSITGVADQLALADLDGTGAVGIVLTTVTGRGATVHALTASGVERAGWPLSLGASRTSYLAIGDLDRDGAREVVVSNGGALYVLKGDGKPLSSAWPRAGAAGAVAIADVDGDGYPEILTTQAAHETYRKVTYSAPVLQAIGRDGAVARSWRLRGDGQSQPVADGKITVADLDGDGTLDVAVVYHLADPTPGVPPHQGYLMLYKTGAPAGRKAIDWAMVFGDARNTAGGDHSLE